MKALIVALSVALCGCDFQAKITQEAKIVVPQPIRCECGHGQCARCGVPWCRAGEYHVTPITDRHGTFPMCQECWAGLTPRERVPFYKSSFFRHRKADEESERLWQLLRENVLKGQ